MAYVFIPADLEEAKILATGAYGAHVVGVRGNYDAVNRLCTELSAEHPWAFVNVNMRPYYAEGSKTLAYETAEQLGWETPDRVVECPRPRGWRTPALQWGDLSDEKIASIPLLTRLRARESG